MHELVGQLVVVLQRVHQRRRVDAQIQRGAQGQPQELGVRGRERVVVGGAVDEVVGQVRARLGGDLDVVDGQVQLLEGEPADLAHHARDEVVRGLRQRVPLGPAGVPGARLLHAEEAVRVQAQRTRAEVGQRVQGVADDHPHMHLSMHAFDHRDERLRRPIPQ